ncbi:ABC transporter ATP-binding protein [Halostreptopolyspora alba]|uniref:ABC transporter ATP-binding protein n=1 Tax=Halostreptopolyspora alba TaxID=2487137 RepID=A0A3N0E8Q4_9ACTN|nr:ABC transporter ATP-binding protein [Nocardiopsaceae bacterium YIM 96095]
MLRVTGVRKAYGRKSVLEGVDLRVRPGRLVGVVGENGSGKTTLLRILSGELTPDVGSVHLDGSLGYCPQHPVLNTELTVDQHLRYFQIAYRLRRLGRAEELIDRLGFAHYRTMPVKHLSGGTRQKLNLLLALMHDPAVVLLDEPYQGFDWETYLRFWELASELSAAGKAIVVVSHLAYDTERLDALHRLRGGVLDEVTTRSTV